MDCNSHIKTIMLVCRWKNRFGLAKDGERTGFCYILVNLSLKKDLSNYATFSTPVSFRWTIPLSRQFASIELPSKMPLCFNCSRKYMKPSYWSVNFASIKPEPSTLVHWAAVRITCSPPTEQSAFFLVTYSLKHILSSSEKSTLILEKTDTEYIIQPATEQLY